MTVKLALLKSGEDVISDIQEMFVDEKLVGYIFNKPCSVKLYGYNQSIRENSTSPMRIELTPWLPLTNESAIPVTLDWVITIVEPMPKLKEMYINGVKDDEDCENTSVDEQSTSDQSD